MNVISKKCVHLLKSLVVCSALFTISAQANGPVGDHVNHLSKHLPAYEKEVHWLIEKVDGIVSRYHKDGAKAAHADAVVEHWEAVKFHAAIETNYVLVYASIWQGLFAVKESIDKGLPINDVRKEQTKLTQALWQGLGAVKMAATLQDKGLLAQIQTREGAPTNSIEALDTINTRLNRVVAKYAEKLIDTSVKMVAETYLNLFEGVEGELIALDANLVEDLEKDFNVTLPKAIKSHASVEDVRQIVATMTNKVNRASTLIKNNANNKKDVF
ncbi:MULTISPECIES: hypothetical protein [Thalassotalea]|uniref:hypothetical protein n=1 Tax=Thalassotalea TaxID=1518149 RepID=UPI00094551DA|nr:MULTISPECIES: hypothetical protein [Thalassotalea]OKY26042.1 hypothetical protein BI291_14105 [Thalassotalea sp. PP2-459]